MDSEKHRKLVEYLNTFITEERRQRIDEVLSCRTTYLTIVLEDIYQPHNASAVLRSCDCFGIQDIHVIENRNTFNASSGVTIGADQWLTIHRYNREGEDNTVQCIQSLKEKGYKIVATTPHEKDKGLENLDVDHKLALLFGSELEGVSDRAMAEADEYVRIPMYGFSESFNISVSAALCMYVLTNKIRNQIAPDIRNLTGSYRLELLHKWIKQSIKAGEQLERKFLQEYEET